MSQLAIISGGGVLPQQLAETHTTNGGKVFVVALSGQADTDWIQDFDHEWFHMGSIKAIISSLQKRGIKKIVMAGTIRRPSWSELKLDWMGVKMLARLKLWNSGDDQLLSAIITELGVHGLEVVSVETIIPSIVTPLGLLTRTAPKESDKRDIQRGVEVARAVGKVDVGQSVIIQQGLVIGVEAIEGTAMLINRCKDIKRTGPGGVLVKLCKPGQETRADLPTIGPDTVKQIHQSGFCGIALEAGKSQIIGREQVREFADEFGIFVIGIDPEDGV